MGTYILLAVICIADDQCQTAQFNQAFNSEQACIDAIPHAMTLLQQQYTQEWMAKHGTAPPPAKVGAGCKQDGKVEYRLQSPVASTGG